MEKERKTELDVEPAALQSVSQEQEIEAPSPAGEKVEAPAGKKRFGFKLYVIAGLLGTALLLGALALSLLLRDGEKPPPEPSQNGEGELPSPEPSPPPQKIRKLNNFTMEPFILSTGEAGSKRFMRIKFSLQLSNDDAIAELRENLSIMREAVYLFIRNRVASDFTIPENRVETLKDMKRLLDRSIQNGRVEKVMITELSVY